MRYNFGFWTAVAAVVAIISIILIRDAVERPPTLRQIVVFEDGVPNV